MLIIGGIGSGKPNILLNLIKQQNDDGNNNNIIDENYLYVNLFMLMFIC